MKNKIRLFINFTLVIYHLLAIFNVYGQNITAQTMQEIKNKNWQEAITLAKKSNDKVLLKIALSQKFLDKKYTANSFDEIVSFLQNNPQWPQKNTLTEIAENYLDYNTSHQIIYAWFKNNTPKTSMGYKFYAIASINREKDKGKLNQIIKNGWIYGDFTINEAQKYYDKFSVYLTEKDHIEKAEALIWQGRTQNIKYFLNFIKQTEYKKNIHAQLALSKNKQDAHLLFHNIPEKYYTNGLIFRYLEYNKKNEFDNKTQREEVQHLLKKIIANEKYAHQSSKMQSYYAREFIKHKDFNRAYKILIPNLGRNAADISNNAFLAGWIALRFLHNPSAALEHFTRCQKVVQQPISVSRANYWLGRSYDDMGQIDKAKTHYQIAALYGYTFYGQLAAIEIKSHKFHLPQHQITLTQKYNFSQSELAQALKIILQYGNKNLAQIYAKAAIAQAKSKDEIIFISSLMHNNTSLHNLVDLSRSAAQKNVFIKEIAFPTPHNNASFAVAPHFGYSIIRHESSFNQHARDSANNGDGFGLMQLTKNTACSTAQHIEIKCDINKLTTNPEYNIKIGTNYLQQLLKMFNGSQILAISAYNAGLGRTRKWIDLYGDPRIMQNPYDIIDWIEMVPFHITRNYIQRVLENMQVYKTILKSRNVPKWQHYFS